MPLKVRCLSDNGPVKSEPLASNNNVLFPAIVHRPSARYSISDQRSFLILPIILDSDLQLPLKLATYRSTVFQKMANGG